MYVFVEKRNDKYFNRNVILLLYFEFTIKITYYVIFFYKIILLVL